MDELIKAEINLAAAQVLIDEWQAVAMHYRDIAKQLVIAYEEQALELERAQANG